jgi:hypothetical protein
MKVYRRTEGTASPVLTSAIDGECSASCLGFCTPGEGATGIRWIGGWLGPIPSMNAVDKRNASCVIWRFYSSVAWRFKSLGVFTAMLLEDSSLLTFLQQCCLKIQVSWGFYALPNVNCYRRFEVRIFRTISCPVGYRTTIIRLSSQ